MRGIYTALVTPFNSRNELDLASFKRILEDQKDAGITGVIPCGTTGESPTLSKDEKKTLIRTAIETLKGSGLKILAGTGTNDTAETVEFSRWASDQGVDGLLVVTPYYNKPTQPGLEAHFRAVADAVRCEVMLYNVPGRTGVSFTPETVVKLATHPRITTIKEATGNVSFSSEILDQLQASGRKMDVLSGDDSNFLPTLSIGGAGVVSVASNLFPRAMVAIQQHYEAGRVSEALQLHQRFYPLFRDLFVESNPGPIKHAMAFAGWCEAHLRAPLAPPVPTSVERLSASLRRCGVERGETALIQLGVLGAHGRMGRWVTQLISGEYLKKARLVSAVGRNDQPEPLLGADAVIDFSSPSAMLGLADLALSRDGTLPAFVVGSTGWKPDERRKLETLAAKTPVLIASNFSTGVMALQDILRAASPVLQKLGYTPVIVETHHRHKKDAPSGTALSIQRTISPEGPGNVQTHSVRAGEVIGDHEVSFYGPADHITIGHFAKDRSIFARGAIEVALWLADQRGRRAGKPGLVRIEEYFEELKR